MRSKKYYLFMYKSTPTACKKIKIKSVHANEKENFLNIVFAEIVCTGADKTIK